MKITNLRNVQKIPGEKFPRHYSLSAEVDVTTRSGLFGLKKKTETKLVFRREHDVHWFWVDTGDWCPGFDVEKLFKGYCARQAIAGNEIPDA